MSQKQGQPIYIPPTTAKTVVFPLIAEYTQFGSDTFFTDFYSPELTSDKVSSEEVNQFFSKIHSAFRNPVSAASNSSNGSSKFPWFLLGFLLSFIVPFIVAFYIPEDFEKGKLLFLILIWSELFVLFVNYFEDMKGFMRGVIDPLFEKCQDIVDDQNEILRSRGLKWNLPEQFPAWIELTKDLEKGANMFQVDSEEKISFNLRKGRYSKDFYLPEMTGGRISNEEMCEFICQINADLRKSFSRTNPRWFVLFIVCDLWILALLKMNSDFPQLLSSSMNFVLVIILLACSIFVATQVSSRYDEKFRVEFAADSQGLISELNETLKSKGLRWNLPAQFPYSIELCKDSEDKKSK